MKNCIKCTSPLNDEDRYCTKCGTEQRIVNTYCNNFCVVCGAELYQYSKLCPRCGKPVKLINTSFKQAKPLLIKKLSNRITLNAILWLSIACIQLILALIIFSSALVTVWKFQYIKFIFVKGLIGFLNIIAAKTKFHYRKQIKTDFVGIVTKNKNNHSQVLFYIWNGFFIIDSFLSKNTILCSLALLCIVAIFVDLFIIKRFIQNNEIGFMQIERAQLPNQASGGTYNNQI